MQRVTTALVMVYSDVTNPLLKMKAIGDYTLGVAEVGLASWTAINVAVKVSEGRVYPVLLRNDEQTYRDSRCYCRRIRIGFFLSLPAVL